MNVCIFCSAQNVAEKYGKDARDVAAGIAKAGHTLVWGGSDVGVMKIIAEAAQSAGGKIIGVTIEGLADKARTNADELIIAKDLSERKKIMLERSDAIVVLAGGMGTLDEAAEALSRIRIYGSTKPVVFLSTDGFYEGLQMQWQRMEDDGFFAKSKETHVLTAGKLALFVSTPEEVLKNLA
jgi:hypothetical protein